MKLLTVLTEAIDMVRLPNGADSCSLSIYELKKVGKKKPEKARKQRKRR